MTHPSLVSHEARAIPRAPSSTPSLSAFAALGLAAPLVRALEHEGYTKPTPIQTQAIPAALAGRDLLACAQTGTGKTAAFMLPVLQRLAAATRRDRRAIRALVLTPTRELAAQIGERTQAYGRHLGLSHVVIYGGVSQRAQEGALRRGCDVLIATPGRLLDLLQQGVLSLADVELLVLDEADRMLDMGFIHDVRRVLTRLTNRKQTLFFSATMPPEIKRLADDILRSPEAIAVTPKVTAAPTVTHAVHHVSHADKRPLLLRVLGGEARRAIVFTRTKHGANRIGEHLARAGISSGVLHGNKSQNARERTLDAFRDGSVRVLVATDIAARGIDVDDVGLVVNYDLPNVAESYVHRIGRAGRAGASGAAVSFCDPTERPLLWDIERLLAFRIASADGQAPVDSASTSASSNSGPSPRPGPARAAGPSPVVFPGDSTRRRRSRSPFRRG